MSGGVGWRLLSSVGMSCSLEMSGVSVGYLGGVCGISWDVWRYLSGIHGIRRCLDVFGGYLGLGPHSLQYGAKTLFWHIAKRHDSLSPDHTETLRYQNGCMSAFQKSLGYAIFCDFWYVRDILLVTVVFDHPVAPSGCTCVAVF